MLPDQFSTSSISRFFPRWNRSNQSTLATNKPDGDAQNPDQTDPSLSVDFTLTTIKQFTPELYTEVLGSLDDEEMSAIDHSRVNYRSDPHEKAPYEIWESLDPQERKRRTEVIKGFLLGFKMCQTPADRQDLLVAYTRGRFPQGVQHLIDKNIALSVGDPRASNVYLTLTWFAFMERQHQVQESQWQLDYQVLRQLIDRYYAGSATSEAAEGLSPSAS